MASTRASSLSSAPVPCSSMNSCKRSYVSDGSAILTNLVNLVVDEETCDIKLVLGDTVIPAHKVLLMASSPYFKKMFLGEWKEAYNATVVLHDLPECQAVFPLFLSFLYCGHISLTVDSVLPIVMLADKYDVQPLAELCKRYMAGVIQEGDLECALKWLPFADLFSLENIKNSCISLIAWNIEIAASHQWWLLLTIEQLASILESHILIVKDEFTLFKMIEKRLLAEDAANITAGMKLIMKHLKFKLMTSAQLLQVEKSMIVNLAGVDTIKMELLEAFRHIALSCSNLEDDKDCEQSGNRWYEGELSHLSKFTDGVAPIHIATSSTGRGIQQPQRWILRYRFKSSSLDKTPHGVSAEVVASKEDVFINPSSQSKPDRYRLQAKFAVCNSQGTVYWTPTVTQEDIVIPQRVGDPLVTVSFICDNTSSMFNCRCEVLPGQVRYSVKLKKL